MLGCPWRMDFSLAEAALIQRQGDFNQLLFNLHAVLSACRMDFSYADAALIAFSGRDTSISFLRYVLTPVALHASV